jgi:cell division protein FtsW (lipid II flippase)
MPVSSIRKKDQTYFYNRRMYMTLLFIFLMIGFGLATLKYLKNNFPMGIVILFGTCTVMMLVL